MQFYTIVLCAVLFFGFEVATALNVSEEEKAVDIKMRVLCLVHFLRENYEEQTTNAIRETWGSRCDKLLFMNTVYDPSDPQEANETDIKPSAGIIQLNGRNVDGSIASTWTMQKLALSYVYKHHRHEADWFLTTDDITYMIMENMRFLLSTKNASTPVAFGCQFKKPVVQLCLSGKATYVFSKMALEVLQEKVLRGGECDKFEDSETYMQTGYCLQSIGIQLADSRDDFLRERFLPAQPFSSLHSPINTDNFWYDSANITKSNITLNCYSQHAVSFHGIDFFAMFVLDFYIYHVKVDIQDLENTIVV